MARPRLEEPEYRLREREGVFYIFWTEDGVTRRASTRQTDLGEARKYLARFKVGREEGLLPEQPTIRDIVTAYLAARGKRVRSRETMEFSSRPIIAFFGDLFPDDITDQVVERYAAQRKRKPGTIIRDYVRPTVM